MFQNTKAILFAAGTISLISFGALADERPGLPERISSAGAVKVAVNAGYPKMEFVDPSTNQLVGFDIDLGNAIAEELGLKAVWTDGAFEQMIPSLASKRVDLIMSGLSDLPERHATADFIDYLRTGTQVYTQSTSALGKIEDICGRKVSVNQGTSMVGDLEEWSDTNCVAKGAEPVEVVLDGNLGQQINNIRQGRADAAAQSMEAVDVVVKKEAGAMKLVGEPIHVDLQGIAFRKEDGQLRDAFFWALQRKLADGTYDKLLDKWDLRASAYPTFTVNLEPAK